MSDLNGIGHDKAHVHGIEHKNGGGDDIAANLHTQFASSTPGHHRDMTKKLLRKVDIHLLPLLILINLSQARLGTLEADLGMHGTDFNLATSILFVGYLLMQLPSNLLITRLRPSWYLGTAMTIWGTISASQAAVHSFGALIACRFFLGFAEAPFFPGAVLLMSSWYTRNELAHRIAWFYAGSSLANAFGGLLGAGVLGNLSGAHGIAGWRWLFIIEGVITIGVATTSIFVLPDYPATTKWLSDEEKAYAQWRLVDDIGEADNGGASSIKDGVKLALKDPRLYLFTVLQHTSLLSQSFQYFFPTIVKTLGYGNIETLLITAPVWIGTFLVSLVVTYTSGKYRDRSIHIICLMLVSVVGNIIVVSSLNTVYPSSDGPRYLPGGSATAAVALLVAITAMVVEVRVISIFERREKAGGTWIYDADPQPPLAVHPGALPTQLDPPLSLPDHLPAILPPSQQERYAKTPVYDSLTTNVPDIAMSFSDERFAYGPFAPHYVPRQYVENYFSTHGVDKLLVLNTTVEDVSKLPSKSSEDAEKWKLTLRKYDSARHVDIWWEEVFDAVILANGHYSIPYVPHVTGLENYIEKFPGRVVHSKYYRSPLVYSDQKVLVIGNSASGHDLSLELISTAQLPVYQSRRSKSRWDGKEPPPGIAWRPIITEYRLDGRIIFEDGTYLDDIDKVIYATGYKASFPFWNSKANGRPLWDFKAEKLINNYWHTFFQDFKTLAVVGMPRALSFRSWEYQATALARVFSNRNSVPLPGIEEQKKWEHERAERSRREQKKFHSVDWEHGETKEWLDGFFQIAGLGTIQGDGRIPPVLSRDLIWALEHIKKYPEPESDDNGEERNVAAEAVYKQYRAPHSGRAAFVVAAVSRCIYGAESLPSKFEVGKSITLVLHRAVLHSVAGVAVCSSWTRPIWRLAADAVESQLPDRRASPALGRRHATKRQAVEPPKLSVVKTQDVQKAKFSYGKPLDGVELSIAEASAEARREAPVDWLAATEKDLEQDIDTSKKELELIKSLLEDIDQKLQTERKPSRKLRDHKILMSACREHSDSMIQVRRERLRQVKFWLGSRDMGRSVPAEAPAEWLAVDIEWRRWLSEQAAARSSVSPIEDADDVAWRILGPLPQILAAYTELES
ncbi:thiol-specific monooxygenase [Seiridium cupressi]